MGEGAIDHTICSWPLVAHDCSGNRCVGAQAEGDSSHGPANGFILDRRAHTLPNSVIRLHSVQRLQGEVKGGFGRSLQR